MIRWIHHVQSINYSGIVDIMDGILENFLLHNIISFMYQIYLIPIGFIPLVYKGFHLPVKLDVRLGGVISSHALMSQVYSKPWYHWKALISRKISPILGDTMTLHSPIKNSINQP